VYIHKQKHILLSFLRQIILNHIEIKKAKKGWKNNSVSYIVLRISYAGCLILDNRDEHRESSIDIRFHYAIYTY